MSEQVISTSRRGGRSRTKFDRTGQFIYTPHPLPQCCLSDEKEGTPIQEFFRNQNVLVTGATGFMGKVVVEKLLASCPGIDCIYVIIRNRKGRGIEERLEELMNGSVFARLRQIKPNYRENVKAVSGDISQYNLGLSEADYAKLANIITVIIHGAATVKFTEPLSISASINLRGTSEMIKFSKTCKNIRSVVHISTAYANVHETKPISEIFYPPKQNYREVLQLLHEAPEELNRREKELIHPAPNTYCCTKKLAEDLVAEDALGLPISVFRPGVVISSYQEPTPGWTDNIAGPTAAIVATGLGVMRVSPVEPKNKANVVPVDMAANAIISCAWQNADKIRNEKSEIPIYNYTSESRNPMTWAEFARWNSFYGFKCPTSLALWYPVIMFVSNPVAFRLCQFFLQTVPAYIVDAVLLMCRKKPILVKANKKLDVMWGVMGYFMKRNISFSDKNTLELWHSLAPMDQTIFPFDIAAMDWDRHAQSHTLGIRVHILNDALATLEESRRKLTRLQIYHRSLQATLLLTFVFFFTYYVLDIMSFAQIEENF